MSDAGTAQGQAVGNTLLGMGGTAVVFATFALVSKLELNFIDGTGMAGFELLMLVTGAFQHGLVRRLPLGLRTKAFKRLDRVAKRERRSFEGAISNDESDFCRPNEAA